MFSVSQRRYISARIHYIHYACTYITHAHMTHTCPKRFGYRSGAMRGADRATRHSYMVIRIGAATTDSRTVIADGTRPWQPGRRSGPSDESIIGRRPGVPAAIADCVPAAGRPVLSGSIAADRPPDVTRPPTDGIPAQRDVRGHADTA